MDAAQSFRDTLSATLHTAGLSAARSKVGVEGHSLPLTAYRVLQDEFQNVQIAEAAAALDNARRVKTAREVDLVRRAVAVADAAQLELLRQARSSGMSDLDVGFTGSGDGRCADARSQCGRAGYRPRINGRAGGPVGRERSGATWGRSTSAPGLTGTGWTVRIRCIRQGSRAEQLCFSALQARL